MADITKDADKLLCLMYKQYLEKRKAHVSKEDAKSFGDSETILKALNLTMPLEDLDDSLRELGEVGFLNNLYASDTVIEVEMENSTIVKMENRFKDGLLDVLEFLAKFRP